MPCAHSRYPIRRSNARFLLVFSLFSFFHANRIAQPACSRFPKTHAAVWNFFCYAISRRGGCTRLGIACYVFQRTVDKTCLYRGDTFVEASSLPLLFSFFHASTPVCTRSTETTNGDDERVKANHLPAEYGYAINSKERATSALLFHAAVRCETIRTPRAWPKKAIGQSTIAIACLSFGPGPR